MPRQDLRVERWLSGTEVSLGVVLAVTPITLWVAWTPLVLLVAVAAAVVSACLLALIHGRRGFAHEDLDPDLPSESLQPVLPDGFVEQIHQIFPLTYHHSRIESPRFRRAMQKLRDLLR
jgi:hypothetical protein